MTLQLGQFEMDIATGIIVAAIICIVTYLSNNWRNKRNTDKRQNVLDNRFREAILSMAEAFDNEIQRLHPDQNIPLIVPKIQRLVQNGDLVF